MRKRFLSVSFGLGLGLILALLLVWGDPSSPATAAPTVEEMEAPDASPAAPVHQALVGSGMAGTSEEARMGVYYGYDEVAGIYEVGHTFWITVTDSSGTAKAHATATTTTEGTAPYFAWSDGFCVEKDDWSDLSLDILPGDWVQYRADDGYSNAVRVGTITALLDPDTNTVRGTIRAPWFDEPLEGFAWNWGLFYRLFTVDPDEGSYFVDFSPDDMAPGMDIEVGYHEPDQDQIANNFKCPSQIWQVYLPIVVRNW